MGLRVSGELLKISVAKKVNDVIPEIFYPTVSLKP